LGLKIWKKKPKHTLKSKQNKIATKTSTLNYKEFIDTNIEKVPAQKIGILALVKRKNSINSLEI
jgi:hypothetical protein